jgi:hypothetical protein
LVATAGLADFPVPSSTLLLLADLPAPSLDPARSFLPLRPLFTDVLDRAK